MRTCRGAWHGSHVSWIPKLQRIIPFFTNISPEILNIAKFNNVHMVSSDKFTSDYYFSKKKNQLLDGNKKMDSDYCFWSFRRVDIFRCFL
jgi:hypothetical protein